MTLGRPAPRLHCARSGEGPPLMLLHAGAGSHLQWLPYFHRFERQFLCLAPDLPGHGASSWPGGPTPADFVPVMVAALQHLLADTREPVHVVGHSFGAAAGLFLALAAADRVASLLMVEPPLFTLLANDADRPLLTEVEQVELACRRALLAGDPLRASELFARYWSGDALWEALPTVFRKLLAEGARARHEVGIASMFVVEVPEDAGARLAHVPVTLVRGGQSPLPPRRIAERLVERLPHARLVTLAEAGHMLPNTHTPEFLPVLRAHLAAGVAATPRPA